MTPEDKVLLGTLHHWKAALKARGDYTGHCYGLMVGGQSVQFDRPSFKVIGLLDNPLDGTAFWIMHVAYDLCDKLTKKDGLTYSVVHLGEAVDIVIKRLEHIQEKERLNAVLDKPFILLCLDEDERTTTIGRHTTRLSAEDKMYRLEKLFPNTCFDVVHRKDLTAVPPLTNFNWSV